MTSREKIEIEPQPVCFCCCGVGKAKRQLVPQQDSVDGRDEVDGGNNLKTCVCCWFMGCDQEGVYVWLKNLLLIYNFAFWLLGCALIALGVYSEVMRQQYSDDTNVVFVTPSVILCLIGSFSFIFSTLGGVGALRDNICMLKVFVYSILFFLIIELTCGILALVFKEPAKDLVNYYILKGLTTYYDDQDLKDVVDYMQREFQCCGGEDYRDWEVNIYHNCSAPGPTACGVPFSCCRQENGSININSMCGYDTINLQIYEASEFVYTHGCINAVLDFLYTNLNVLAGIFLGVFLPQITGIVLGMWYVSSIEKCLHEIYDAEFRQSHVISMTALNRASLIVDGEKTYPIYLRRPSLISEDKASPTSSVRYETRNEQLSPLYPQFSDIRDAGEVLMEDTIEL